MINVEVLFFGPAEDVAGVDRRRVELPPGAVLETLMARLCADTPALAGVQASLRCAVNREFVTSTHVLVDGDEVALIPPVSGGAGRHDLVELTGEPIDPQRVQAFVEGDPAHGAVLTFEGTTRGETHPEHGELLHLEYRAYGDMAVEQVHRLIDQARERWTVGSVAVVHRTGVVGPAASSVVIAVAAAHRDEAFAACRWLIDTLKREVPIWKREVWADGSHTWSKPDPVDHPVSES
ncbi:MAG: molybdopterin converting factor [bacterium]|nr:molybdopterin converting factor [bacterium]